MKLKKFLAVVLSAVLLIMPLSLTASAADVATGGVSEIRRVIDGIFSTIVWKMGEIVKNTDYSAHEELSPIYELEDSYVPQGYCYMEDEGIHVVSYYSDTGDASILVLSDGETGQRLKTVTLKYPDGKVCKNHVGGVGDYNGTIFVTDKNSVYYVTLDEINETPDYAAVTYDGLMEVNIGTSYCNVSDGYLYVGKFYCFTTDGQYDSPAFTHTRISLFENSYAQCYAFDLARFDELFSSDEAPVPDMVFTTCDRVQGFTRTADGGFALSLSYGRDHDSYLKLYSDVTQKAPAGQIYFGDRAVPRYDLSRSANTGSVTLPPLLEGLDLCGDKVLGIFESCSEKFSSAKFIVDSICALG